MDEKTETAERMKKNARVLGAIETDDHSLIVDFNSKDKFVVETVAWNALVGNIKDDPDLPVYVIVTYATMNDKPIVFWYCCGRYADYTMAKEWLKKQFPNSKGFVDSMNVHQLR